jgi:deferrochelatase/peroxidase EfeB
MPDLDLADVQGTILRGYRVDFARHFILEIADVALTRTLLAALVSGDPALPQVTTAAPWTVKPTIFLNLGLTCAGLRKLGVAEDSLSTFPASFVLGATDSGTALTVGDTGDSAPANWIGGLSDGSRVHLIVSLWACDSLQELESASAALRAAFQGALNVLSAQDANALPDNKVHFGYTDNIAQPRVEGAPPRKRPDPDQQPIAPTGEFLMGYPSQNGGGQVYSVSPDELSLNSSFSAFRILEQDVVGFEAFLTGYAATAGVDPELLAAKVCGRWRNGVPMTLSPTTPEPTPPLERWQLNDFDYDDQFGDTYGNSCPVGSHIRRSNPRSEQVIGAPEGGHLHRIVRRAMPYGPAYDPAHPVDTPRGLVGHFINVDLQNQFEFLMGQWINTATFVRSVKGPNGDNPVLNISGQDVLLGNDDPSTSSFTLSYPRPEKNETLTGFPRFITTRGGAYLYLPSITAIHYLVGLAQAG